jgi:hypothetical protein
MTLLMRVLTASSLLLAVAVSARAQAPSFLEFESGPVRPIALTADRH